MSRFKDDKYRYLMLVRSVFLRYVGLAFICILCNLPVSGKGVDLEFATHTPACRFNTDTLIKQRLNDPALVPQITFTGISQEHFQDAFNVLQDCQVAKVPTLGFQYPFIAPGGQYGSCWWQLDGAIALNGAKWVNQPFSEDTLRGFAGVQKTDGRIPLYGFDTVPNFPVCSSLPKFFIGAYNVLKQSQDRELILATYTSMKKYLDWWLSSAREDETTGLITGVFEESFPPVERQLKTVAQVDLNVEVVTGCHYVALLARHLKKNTDHQKYTAAGKELTANINRYMWNESAGAYFNYNVKEAKRDNRLVAYAFDPFRLQTLPSERAGKMIQMLTDDAYFNWNHNAVTSVSKTDSTYNETVGAYNGAPAWSGDIWTLRNEAIIDGLENIGRFDLASELSLKTVYLFNNNYSEFIKPSDGSGHGVQRYAWSAAQYIQIIIERIFGIDYNRFDNTITIRPNIPRELSGKTMGLQRLLLPDGTRLSLQVRSTKDTTTIKYSVSGTNKMNIVLKHVGQSEDPVAASTTLGHKKKVVRTRKGTGYLYEVRNGKISNDAVKFIHSSGSK